METGNGEIIYDEIMRQTDRAVQYRFNKTKVWIPVSQIKEEDLVKQTVILPMWLIKNDGLEEGVSTRLLIYAATLIRQGVPADQACDVAIARPITDDPDMLRSIIEVVKAIF